MKGSLPVFVGFLIAFCPSAVISAAGIYQTEYKYEFDGSARDPAHTRTFVMCDEVCVAGPYLTPAPRYPALSLRVSQDVPTVSEGRQKGPEGQGRQTGVKNDRRSDERSPDAAITLLFGLDSATITDTERARLSSFIDSLGAKARRDDLSVTGYTCDLGSKARNDALALKRAEAVAVYLRKAGLHPLRITGLGKCCFATDGPHKRHLNRRVEIRISEREATQ